MKSDFGVIMPYVKGGFQLHNFGNEIFFPLKHLKGQLQIALDFTLECSGSSEGEEIFS